MKYPIITNAHAVLASLAPDCVPVSPAFSTIGSGTEISLAHMQNVAVQLEECRSGCVDFGDFDARAAIILRQHFPLSYAAAADCRFWQVLSLHFGTDIVRWRWKKESIADIPKSRVAGKWKDTFARLWWRADIAMLPEDADPFRLVPLAGEDFWVGVIERNLAADRRLIRVLLQKLFAEGHKADHRQVLAWLREIRVTREFAAMTDEQITSVVEEGISRAKWHAGRA